MNYFTFDGIDSRTYNTYIATSNAFDAPGREDEVIKVPGSNNIYYLTEGTYKPFDIKLYCYIPSNMQVKTDDLRNFLLSKGTCTYTEAIRPNEFRVARFIEAYELDVSDRVSAAFVLTFKAQPQRYLTTNTPITTTATADTTTDTTMSLNTVPTPINISLNGNTTQEGSSGKNKLPIEAYTGIPYNPSAGTAISPTAKPTQWTNNGDGTFKMTLTSWEQASLITAPLTAGRYVARVTTVTAGMRVGIYVVNADGTANRVSAVKNGTTANEAFQAATTLTAGQYFAFYIAGGSGECTIKEPMVEAGSTATAYEPHISPTNPQTIHNVSGDNTINVASFNIWDEVSIVSSSRIQSQNYIPVLPNTAYYRKSPSNILVTYYNANKEQLSTGTWGTGLFTTPQNCNFIKFMVDPAYGTTYKHDICINVSDTQKNGTYEPYTRQSYPLYLPVENYLNAEELVTENNVFKKNSENNFTLKKVSTSSRSTSWATCNIENGKTYTFHMKAENGFSSGVKIRSGINGSQIQDIGTLVYSSKVYSITFVASANAQQLQIYFVNSATGVGESATVTDLQLEEGTKANAYHPYGTPPIELNKIGTYQDYIYKNGGKWYVHKETASVDMGTLTYQTDNGGVYFYSSVSGKGRTNFDLLCTCYTVTTSTNTSGMTDYQIKGQTSGAYIFIKDSRYTVATDLKTALSGQTLKYNLATATNTEITDTTLINQLNNIEKAYSYNGTTNILQVSNDNGFMLEVVSLHSNNVSSDYKGEPIITVNSTGLIYFNGCVIKVNQAPMTINSQTMQAYNGTVNLNNYIEADDFPMIEAGTNVIGSEMPLTIVPNYWKL